jgi:SAM-dependent methyltransferase
VKNLTDFQKNIDTKKAHFIEEYSLLVNNLINAHPDNLPLAMAQAIGAPHLEAFNIQGEQHLEVLNRFGLQNGMHIYDLACGSGRTASALHRSNWSGSYKGADVVPELVEYLKKSCAPYDAVVHIDLSIESPNSSLDIIFAWSLFTHLHFEETFIYIEDAYRALKSGGKLMFSFLEFKIPSQWAVFNNRVKILQQGELLTHLDIFLHREWICAWAQKIGFGPNIIFVDGDDSSFLKTGCFGQSIAVLEK